MAAVFPLFDLPVIPIERILSFLSPLDIFDFSLCSKTCESLVKSSKKNRQLHIKLIFDESGHSFRFYDETGRYYQGGWLFNKNESKRSEEMRIIGGIRMRFRRNEGCAWSTSFKRHQEISMKVVLDRFLDCFTCHFKELIVDSSKIPLNLKTILESINECEELVIWGNTVQVSKENMDILISQLTVTKKLVIKMPTELGFQPSRPLKLVANEVEVEAGCGNWITSQHLLDADCAKISIVGPQIILDTHEMLIFNWFNSNNRKLEYVKVFGIMRFDINALNLKQFEGKSWDPNVRSRYFKASENVTVDLKDGVDILRSDGLLATVYYESYKFHFVVWHNRFPPLPVV